MVVQIGHSQTVLGICLCLFSMCRDMFGVPSSSANGPDELEERRRKFLFSLNSSGKYYAFKEDLKVCEVPCNTDLAMHNCCIALFTYQLVSLEIHS